MQMADERETQGSLAVKAFAWEHWAALWQIRNAQLTEGGIVLSPEDMETPPVLRNVGREDYEWDFHQIESVYLSGGGFWLAWWDDVPVGYVGAQDLGGVAELRHMFVRAAYRRRGIGTRLVQALLAHCAARGIQVVELWTAPDDIGRLLYAGLGFRQCDRPGPGFEDVEAATGRSGEGEIRMRIALRAPDRPTATRESTQELPR